VISWEELKPTLDEVLEDCEQCVACCTPLTRETAWVLDNIHDKRHYCYQHAPEDAIRVKDLMRPLKALA